MTAKKSTINNIVQAYNLLVRHVDEDARSENTLRAYGVVVRSAKGALVEGIAKNIIEIAWANIGGKSQRLSFEKKPILIPIRHSYINKIKDVAVRKHIRKNMRNYIYKFTTDTHVSIDGTLVIGVECKAYTENAMLKRIAVDSMFLKHAHKNAQNVLLQLESQLGGDYGNLDKKVHYGSYPTHTILSYFDNVNLHIITLLEGERKVDKPIHKKKFFKKLERGAVKRATKIFEKLLTVYL